MVFISYFKGYSVEYSKHAKKDLKKIDPVYAKKIKELFEELVEGAQNLDVKKLKTSDDLFRLRVGRYRAIFEEHAHTITIYIVSVGHRKDIYDDL